jgi:uncharacterized iron-regulated membrane protein
MTYLKRWVSHPQTVWLRKAIFQLHLWSGIGIGLYILLVSVTGSIVVYRNELYDAATPKPIKLAVSGPQLDDEQFRTAIKRLYPGYAISVISRSRKGDEPAAVSLENKSGRKNRLFNPYTGEDLGNATPIGITLVSKLLELHDDLLGGETGRRINGYGALLLIVLSATGMVVWWPGIKSWRRSLMVRRKVGWRRFTWDLHSAVGFWSLAFIGMFALSGVYLSNPQFFQDLVDRIEPPTAENAGIRTVDSIVYWLAYLHFGRINGIGIPCRGPGLCDQATKFLWAFVGLAPAAMFVTGAIMWWNRVLRKKK